MKMKKCLGLMVMPLLLVGCATKNGDSESATMDSLRKENSELRQKLANYEKLDEKKDSSAPEETESKESTSNGNFNLNEDLVLAIDNTPVANLKITQVTTNQSAFPEHMIGLDSYDTTKMIAVTIDYSNIDMEEAFLPNTHDFQAYDQAGNALKRVNQQSGQDSVPKGRTGNTQIYFETEIPGNDVSVIEIDYVPSQNKVATFKIEVSH